MLHWGIQSRVTFRRARTVKRLAKGRMARSQDTVVLREVRSIQSFEDWL